MNQTANQPPTRAEMILRYSIVLCILVVVLGVLAYAGVNGVIGAIVTDQAQAQAMTSLLCVSGVAVLGLVGIIVGAIHLLMGRNLAMAYQSDGVKAMLMSTAGDRNADAELKRAAYAVLSNGQASGNTRMSNYQEPQAQLSAPQIITVPRYMHNGQAKPVNAPMLRTATQDDETGQDIELTAPLPALMKFAGLETPARAEWGGKKETYGECAKFFAAHGMLDKQSNGGYRWADAYPIVARAAWLRQFDEAT